MNYALYLLWVYCCLIISVKYSIGKTSSSGTHSTVLGSTRSRALATMGAYCKSVYTPKDAEELLNFTSKPYMEDLNWWKRYTGYGRNLEQPLCSAFPNALYPKRNRLADLPISRNKLFQRQNIEIPVQPGTMKVHSNEFQYIQRDPLQRPFLECHCNIVGDAAQVENICVDGTVYLSRGLCADMSFFVHAKNPSGNLKVIAHIFFIRPKNKV